MIVGVTGATGFLGWHIRARLQLCGIQAAVATRSTFANDDSLMDFVSGADVIVHCAGVNRASTPAEISEGNLLLAAALISALQRTGRDVPVLYSNSTHSDTGSVYGDAKQAAADLLADHQRQAGQPFLDLVLPHLFGEYGKPHYNSAVATFAHELANDGKPELNLDGQLELLHCQAVAERCLAFCADPVSARERIPGREFSVGEVWDLMSRQHNRYVRDFTVPKFESMIELQLFNTTRSHMFMAGFYPRPLVVHTDNRGAFAELARSDGPGQTSMSTSGHHVTRGDHYHLDKVERFVVLAGEADIKLRRVLTDITETYRVSGATPTFVDMPPLTTHNITNVGDTELLTIFWAADHFDPENPDTYVDPVQPGPAVSQGGSR